jgi:hypothetical protein
MASQPPLTRLRSERCTVRTDRPVAIASVVFDGQAFAPSPFM